MSMVIEVWALVIQLVGGEIQSSHGNCNTVWVFLCVIPYEQAVSQLLWRELLSSITQRSS